MQDDPPSGQVEEKDVNIRHFHWRRAVAAILSFSGIAVSYAQANTIEIPFVKARFVQVDVYDREDGAALPVYARNGRNYIVGTPGHEYAVRIRNCTNGRVLVVTSVDGVNVISGDTAAPSQSGYVLDAWGSIEIAGWRKSMQRTAAFYFSDLGDSYAARTGRPQNVGVVGVAVFQEKPQYFGATGPGEPVPYEESKSAAAAPSRREADAISNNRPTTASRERADAAASSMNDSFDREKKSVGKLGTGHGRSEDSQAMSVAFERSTDSPLETVSIQYDRRENLVAMNVLPQPYLAHRSQPDPFPGAIRFAADPPR